MTDPRGEALQPFSRQQLDSVLADLKEMWGALADLAMSVPGAKEVIGPRKDLPETIDMIFAQAATNAAPHEGLMLTVWKDGSYLCQSVEDDREVQMTTDWFVSIPLVAGYQALQSATAATPANARAVAEDAVARAAIVITQSPLIDAPKLPPVCWEGLARAVLEAAALPDAPQAAPSFETIRDAIAVRMGGHTISVFDAEAWTTFLGLLRQVKASECALPASAEVESTKVADLKRQLAAERDGRMRAEALVDDTRRANESLRSETVPSGTAKVPEGWKLVPVEPTTDILKAGISAFNKGTEAEGFINGIGQLERAYRAMLAAAPSPDGNERRNG